MIAPRAIGGLWERDEQRTDDEALVLADLLARPAWMADGACHEHGEVDWFPTRGQSTRAAKAVCAGCLVREDCLEFALATAEKFGIWGGRSERERRRIRTARRGAT